MTPTQTTVQSPLNELQESILALDRAIKKFAIDDYNMRALKQSDQEARNAQELTARAVFEATLAVARDNNGIIRAGTAVLDAALAVATAFTPAPGA